MQLMPRDELVQEIKSPSDQAEDEQLWNRLLETKNLALSFLKGLREATQLKVIFTAPKQEEPELGMCLDKCSPWRQGSKTIQWQSKLRLPSSVPSPCCVAHTCSILGGRVPSSPAALRPKVQDVYYFRCALQNFSFPRNPFQVKETTLHCYPKLLCGKLAGKSTAGFKETLLKVRVSGVRNIKNNETWDA